MLFFQREKQIISLVYVQFYAYTEAGGGVDASCKETFPLPTEASRIGWPN